MKPNSYLTMPFILLCVLFCSGGVLALPPLQNRAPEYNKLTKEEHNVILLKGTERPRSGKYTYSKAVGTYICRRCNSPLFDSTHKFENDCGWPCFDDATKDAVERFFNGARTEIQCANCGGHLGHQFLGEDFTPKNVRNCVNSISLYFVAKGKELPGVIFAASKSKPTLEYLLKKLLEQLSSSNADEVANALSQLEFEQVSNINFKNKNLDEYEYVPEDLAIGIKLTVKNRLIELLDSASADIKKLAIQRLGELGPKADDALPKLRELLANDVSIIKLNAAVAVRQISGCAKESATVLAMLIRNDEAFALSAVWPLEWMGPEAFSAFETIEELSRDPRDNVREAATKILGSFGPTKKLATEGPIAARLSDTSFKIRVAACLSLLKIGGKREEAVETLIGIVDQVIEKTSAPFKETPQEKLVISAISALGQFGEDAADSLIPVCLHLNSKNVNIRQAAVNTLGKSGIGNEKAIPYLAKAIRDTETAAVALVHHVVDPGDDAAKALGSFGIAALPILLDSLNDPEVVVRIRAARELGRIQEAARQTVGPIMAKLSDPNAGVRLEAIKSLARLGKKANAAAPELTKFLFAAATLTSFPSGGGIGLTESLSSEALQALRSVEATEEQIVPAILDALDRNQNLTLEALSILRQYPNRSNEFEMPLRRLLAGKNLGAACALAAFGANDSDIQAVLSTNLMEGEHVNSIAALGIGQLVAHGHKLDEAVFEKASVAAKKDYAPLSILIIMLRLTPDDGATVASLMAEARIYSAWMEVCILADAEVALIELIHHESVADALLQDLDDRTALTRSLFFSPRILIAANRHTERAFACLERELAENADASAFLSVADFLGKRPLCEPSKSLLIKLLHRNDGRLVGGDFHGKGGEWHFVGDRAALALVRLKEFDTLFSQLNNTEPVVRTRIMNALEASDDDAVKQRLRDADLK